MRVDDQTSSNDKIQQYVKQCDQILMLLKEPSYSFVVGSIKPYFDQGIYQTRMSRFSHKTHLMKFLVLATCFELQTKRLIKELKLRRGSAVAAQDNELVMLQQRLAFLLDSNSLPKEFVKLKFNRKRTREIASQVSREGSNLSNTFVGCPSDLPFPLLMKKITQTFDARKKDFVEVLRSQALASKNSACVKIKNSSKGFVASLISKFSSVFGGSRSTAETRKSARASQQGIEMRNM